jgi:penicillin-binding protein 2
MKLYDRRRRCWKAGGHGWVNLHQAIKESCDVYFYSAGRDLKIDKISHYAEEFGFGRLTGLDLPGERSGLVPNQEYRNGRGTQWYAGETISVAIGQGPILATPLQVAQVMAVAANGGYRVTPYLVEGQQHPPERLDLDADALEQVRDGLRAVVNDGGTGRIARVKGLVVAGKTGTAQVVEHKTRTVSSSVEWQFREHAWFAAFAPYEAPELVVVVFVEHGGSGSGTAAPLARAMYEKYLELQRRSKPTEA